MHRSWRQNIQIAYTYASGGTALLFLLGSSQGAIAQVIPTLEGNATQVTPDIIEGNAQLDISGGQRSGHNIFHDFNQFNVDTGHTVRFNTTADIKNVLSRVRGSASSIDGSLQLVGSDANLYLINPAGILFGQNAQLNLPGNFTATTATSIGFGNQGNNLWKYASQPSANFPLGDSPTTFNFETDGSIVNLGELAVNPGQSISLMGSTIINTGSLVAPGGDITLTAVTEGTLLRIGQENQLLSIEVSPDQTETLFSSESLVALLTGNTRAHANTLEIDNDGTVHLKNERIAITNNNGNANCTACILTSGSFSTDSHQTGGDINLLGTQVGLFGSSLSASGPDGGGKLRIGGDYQGGPTMPTARHTYIDNNSTLSADATESGNGGQVYIWSDESTQFYGQLSAQGGSQSGDGGFAEISGQRNLDYQGTVELTAAQGRAGTLLFDPSTIIIKNGAGPDTPSTPSLPNIFNDAGNATIPFVLYEENLEQLSATSLLLQATQDIIIEDLTDNTLALPSGLSIMVQADVDGDGSGGFVMQSTSGPDIDTLSGGSTVRIEGATIDAGNIVSNNAGNLTFQAQGDISITGIQNQDGELEIFSTAGSIDTTGGAIENTRGNLSLRSPGDIATADIRSQEGRVEIISTAGSIDTTGGTVEGTQGEVVMRAQDEISTATVETQNGRLELVSTVGSIDTTSGSLGSNGDLIIRAPNDIYTAAVETQNGRLEIISTAGSIDTTSGTLAGSGGEMVIRAQSHISTAAVSNQTGQLELSATSGDIETESLSNTSGNILLNTTGSFRATGSFVNGAGQAVSIQTSSGQSITLNHGGDGATPFFVGDASVNGTASRMSNQDTSLEDMELPGSFRQGSIELLTNAPFLAAVSPSITPTPSPGTEPTSPPRSQSVEGTAPPALLSQTVPIAPILDERDNLDVILTSGEEVSAADIFNQIETTAGEQFGNYLALSEGGILPEVATLNQARDTLKEAKNRLGINSALIYVYYVPNADAVVSMRIDDSRLQGEIALSQGIPKPNDLLQIMLITPEGKPVIHRQSSITRSQVEATAGHFRHQITRRFSQGYFPPAQQLYSWLLAPIEAPLLQQNIDSLSFVLPDGLRMLPLAALHNGQRFLIEQYSVGLLPTFSLTNWNVNSLAGKPVLGKSSVVAMGASQFINQPPLPAVEAEIAFISENAWAGEVLLNEDFTLQNLTAELANNPYDIVHLATHASFEPGSLENSYLQFWDERVPLSQIDEIGLDAADINLIILSACNTALGDIQSEYGFAGLSVNAGSQSALASLWPVSDEGTLGFMTQLYQRLAIENIRIEALRQAQLSMLQDEVGISHGQVYGPNDEIQAFIPALAASGAWDFSHPFYWSAFTMIGSPW